MLSFEPLDAQLGATVRGVDPTQSLDVASIEPLTDALLAHGVLVLPAVALEPAELIRFARSFGEIAPRPESERRYTSHGDGLQLSQLTNVHPDGQLVDFDEPQAVFLRGLQRWHADDSFRDVPAQFSMQYALEVPQRGGQTQFADMRQVLKLLPPEDRAEMAALRLVHSYEYSWAGHTGHLETLTDEERDRYRPVEHRWIRTHRDGSESLYMGASASHIVDRDPAESRQWFAEIEAQLPVHDVLYEHQWKPHDLLIWDNHTTMHRDLGYDITNERRIMHRVIH